MKLSEQDQDTDNIPFTDLSAEQKEKQQEFFKNKIM